jgi:hypothetical protein
MSSNQLDSLPVECAGLVQLEVLLLPFNGFVTMPACIATFSQLREIDMTGCGLTFVDPGIISSWVLVSVFVSCFSFWIFPLKISFLLGIGTLKNLESIKLDRNCLKGLPPS